MKIYLCSSAAPRAFHLTSGSAAACARNKTQHSPIAERIHHSESILIYIYILYIYTYIFRKLLLACSIDASFQIFCVKCQPMPTLGAAG